MLAAGRPEARQAMLQPMLRLLVKTTLAAFAIAAVLTAPAPTRQIAAPVRLASIVCGSSGCGVVSTKPQKRRKFQTMGHG